MDKIKDFLKKYGMFIIGTIVVGAIVALYYFIVHLEEIKPEIEWWEIVFALVGGLGIFLYGINLMGDSLKAIAGKRMKLII